MRFALQCFSFLWEATSNQFTLTHTPSNTENETYPVTGLPNFVQQIFNQLTVCYWSYMSPKIVAIHIYVPWNLGTCAISGLSNRVRAPELSNRRELRALRVGETLSKGTPQVWGLSVPIPRPRKREFLWVGELPRSHWCGGLSTCLMLMVMTELQELLTHVPYLYTRWKLK